MILKSHMRVRPAVLLPDGMEFLPVFDPTDGGRYFMCSKCDSKRIFKRSELLKKHHKDKCPHFINNNSNAHNLSNNMNLNFGNTQNTVAGSSYENKQHVSNNNQANQLSSIPVHDYQYLKQFHQPSSNANYELHNNNNNNNYQTSSYNNNVSNCQQPSFPMSQNTFPPQDLKKSSDNEYSKSKQNTSQNPNLNPISQPECPTSSNVKPPILQDSSSFTSVLNTSQILSILSTDHSLLFSRICQLTPGGPANLARLPRNLLRRLLLSQGDETEVILASLPSTPLLHSSQGRPTSRYNRIHSPPSRAIANSLEQSSDDRDETEMSSVCSSRRNFQIFREHSSNYETVAKRPNQPNSYSKGDIPLSKRLRRNSMSSACSSSHTSVISVVRMMEQQQTQVNSLIATLNTVLSHQITQGSTYGGRSTQLRPIAKLSHASNKLEEQTSSQEEWFENEERSRRRRHPDKDTTVSIISRRSIHPYAANSVARLPSSSSYHRSSTRGEKASLKDTQWNKATSLRSYGKYRHHLHEVDNEYQHDDALHNEEGDFYVEDRTRGDSRSGHHMYARMDASEHHSSTKRAPSSSRHLQMCTAPSQRERDQRRISAGISQATREHLKSRNLRQLHRPPLRTANPDDAFKGFSSEDEEDACSSSQRSSDVASPFMQRYHHANGLSVLINAPPPVQPSDFPLIASSHPPFENSLMQAQTSNHRRRNHAILPSRLSPPLDNPRQKLLALPAPPPLEFPPPFNEATENMQQFAAKDAVRVFVRQLAPPPRDIFCLACPYKSDVRTDVIVCDGCCFATHLHCLSPPLKSLNDLPPNDWFCRQCIQTYCEQLKTGRERQVGELVCIARGGANLYEPAIILAFLNESSGTARSSTKLRSKSQGQKIDNSKQLVRLISLASPSFDSFSVSFAEIESFITAEERYIKSKKAKPKRIIDAFKLAKNIEINSLLPANPLFPSHQILPPLDLVPPPSPVSSRSAQTCLPSPLAVQQITSNGRGRPRKSDKVFLQNVETHDRLHEGERNRNKYRVASLPPPRDQSLLPALTALPVSNHFESDVDDEIASGACESHAQKVRRMKEDPRGAVAWVRDEVGTFRPVVITHVNKSKNDYEIDAAYLDGVNEHITIHGVQYLHALDPPPRAGLVNRTKTILRVLDEIQRNKSTLSNLHKCSCIQNRKFFY